MKIALFDEQLDEGKRYARLIGELCQTRGRPAEVVFFTEINQLTNAFCEEPYDMVFVEMHNMCGVEAARKVREMSQYCPLVIVSDSTDYGVEGFRVNALHYLMKPLREESLEEVFVRCEAL